MPITSTSVRCGDNSTREHGNDFEFNKGMGKPLQRTVDSEPQADSWKGVAAGSVVPLGLAGAAAFATYVTTHERVAISAWIAVAVVGSASVISAASVSRRRIVSIEKSDLGNRLTSRNDDDLIADSNWK
jgi:hypothetical protein